MTKEADSQAVNERYWLNSRGVFVYVTRETPLFITQTPDAALCFKAERKSPYNTDLAPFTYTFHIGVALNPKLAHLQAVKRFLGHPTGLPDMTMVEKPIWSTWARYKAKIDDVKVREFLEEISSRGYTGSQLEIDDLWEENGYGSLSIDKCKWKTSNICESF